MVGARLDVIPDPMPLRVVISPITERTISGDIIAIGGYACGYGPGLCACVRSWWVRYGVIRYCAVHCVLRHPGLPPI
jgi:hypothetical protein